MKTFWKAQIIRTDEEGTHTLGSISLPSDSNMHDTIFELAKRLLRQCGLKGRNWDYEAFTYASGLHAMTIQLNDISVARIEFSRDDSVC